MTEKGQVTIPVEIRTRLGLKPHDTVRFEILEDGVKLSAAPSRILRHYGAVQPRERPEDWRAVRDAVETLMAEDVVAEDRVR